MRVLGIFIGADNFIQTALLSRSKGQIKIENLSRLSAISPSQIENKQIKIVTSPPPEKTICRKISLKIGKRSTLLKLLPFQMEDLLPFPPDETIVYPLFFSGKEETEVVVYATTSSVLKEHLETVRRYHINPDQVSSVPAALLRFALWIFPNESQIILLHENSGIAVDQGKIVSSHFFENRERLEFFFQTKYSSYSNINEKEGSYQGYSFETLKSFALPLGLALEGFESDGCQFLDEKREKKIGLLFPWGINLVALFICLLTWGINEKNWSNKKNILDKKIALFLPEAQGDFRNKLTLWEEKLKLDAKKRSLLFDLPNNYQTLAWLDSFEHPIEISSFHYSLVHSDKINDKENLYRAKIELAFRADNPKATEQFREALKQEPTLIDLNQPILWNTEKEFYTVSFWLRRI